MEIVFTKDNLQRPLLAVQGIVEKKGIYPLLSHFLISADPTGVFLEATDLEIGLKLQVNAQVKEEGQICLPARKLYEIVREMPEGAIVLRTEEGHWARLSGSRISLRIPGLDPRDFPSFSQPLNVVLELSADLLKGMVRKVAFCASSQESSMNLHGIYMEIKDGKLRLVATDGHRLALCQKEVDGEEDQSAILPRKGMAELRKVFQEEEKIQVAMGENLVHFIGGRATLSVRVLEGKFPEYRYVVPRGLENRVLVDRRELLSALRRADVFASERAEGVKISLLPEGQMELRAGRGDTGEFTEVLPVAYEGARLDVVFNPKYLIEALTVMEGERIAFELRDSESAALLKEEGKEDYLYVIMPMRMVE